MGVRQPRYSKEEFARRGQALYEQRVRPQVEEGNIGRIVAIDIETGEFEVADDPLAASDQLFARCPDAQPWLVRIGHRALHRFVSRMAIAASGSGYWREILMCRGPVIRRRFREQYTEPIRTLTLIIGNDA